MLEQRSMPIPFDQDTFRTLLHRTIDHLLAHQYQQPCPAMNGAAPQALVDLLTSAFSAAPAQHPEAVIKTLCDELLHHRCRLGHPRFFGLIPSAASPLSWLGDIITAGINALPVSQFLAEGASNIEHRMIRWSNDLIGYGADAGGVFLSGGSMANMTALVVARHLHLDADTHMKGVVYYSDQTHSSMAKSLRIAGLYEHQVCVLPSDDHYCLDTAALKAAIARDVADGRRPFAVVANAGTTNTGSIDDLEAIADICEHYGLWLHVDGAFGASILLSPRYRDRLKGLHRADSVSWDAHKWLFQTYGCSIVLMKRKQDLLSTFCVQPEYLTDARSDDLTHDHMSSSPELSRPARATKLWLTLNLMGSDKMAEQIEWAYQLVEWVDEALRGQDAAWQIVTPPQQGIINFRYVPDGWDEEAVDRLNSDISADMLEEDYATVLTTRLSGQTVLRICALNPVSTQHDMVSTVEHLTHFARARVQS